MKKIFKKSRLHKKEKQFILETLLNAKFTDKQIRNRWNKMEKGTLKIKDLINV
jgi:hypothetical protein